jgi:chromosome segregation ATPase
MASIQRAKALVESKGDRRALPETFETLDDEICALPIVGGPWRRFSATLLLPNQPSRPIHQTVMAERFFNGSLLEQTGLNARLQLAMPNILVGGGLLLTFFGLIMALDAAAASVGAADIATSRAGLHALLQAAGFKFRSSLAGLGFSIVYLILYKQRIHKLEKAIRSFCDALAERMPMVSPHFLAQESNKLLDQQLSAQQQLVNDLVTGLGDRLDGSFNARLAEQMEPLRAAIDKMAASMSTMNQDALKDMIGSFGQVLRDTAGSQLSQLAGTLTAVSERLEGFSSGFAEVQAELKAAGQNAASELSASMAEAARQMLAASEASRAAVSEGTNGMGAKLGEALSMMTNSLEQLHDRLTASGDSAASRMQAGAEETSRIMTAAGIEMQAKARIAAEEFSSRIAMAAAGFGQQIEPLKAILGELPGKLQLATNALAEQTSAADAAASRLQPVSAMLERAGSHVADATALLPALTAELLRLEQALQTTTAAQSNAYTGVSDLAKSLDDALGRFQGLDRELGAVFSELETGLLKIQEQVVHFAQEVDNSTARAVGSLQGAIENLGDSTAELAELFSKGRV